MKLGVVISKKPPSEKKPSIVHTLAACNVPISDNITATREGDCVDGIRIRWKVFQYCARSNNWRLTKFDCVVLPRHPKRSTRSLVIKNAKGNLFCSDLKCTSSVLSESARNLFLPKRIAI